MTKTAVLSQFSAAYLFSSEQPLNSNDMTKNYWSNTSGFFAPCQGFLNASSDPLCTIFAFSEWDDLAKIKKIQKTTTRPNENKAFSWQQHNWLFLLLYPVYLFPHSNARPPDNIGFFLCLKTMQIKQTAVGFEHMKLPSSKAGSSEYEWNSVKIARNDKKKSTMQDAK